MPTPLAEDISAARSAGVPRVDLWLTKLETYLQTHSPTDAQQLLDGLELPTAVYSGGLLISTGEAALAHWNHFESRLKLCALLNVPTLVVVSDPGDPRELPRAAQSLAQAAAIADGYGMTLALEFRANGIVSSCETAVSLVESIARPNLGVCLDLFHFMKGPSKLEDLKLLTPANLKAVQLCDVAQTPRELFSDAERILPGEGDLPVAAVVQALRAIPYTGPVSVEVFNPILWKSKPTQVYELAWTAVQRCLQDSGR
jgi:sugar phosphate isomerase/epimerase